MVKKREHPTTYILYVGIHTLIYPYLGHTVEPQCSWDGMDSEARGLYERVLARVYR